MSNNKTPSINYSMFIVWILYTQKILEKMKGMGKQHYVNYFKMHKSIFTQVKKQGGNMLTC